MDHIDLVEQGIEIREETNVPLFRIGIALLYILGINADDLDGRAVNLLNPDYSRDLFLAA